MHILVRTVTHRLIYLADRLVREGHTVELHHCREQYAAAWGGIFGGSRSFVADSRGAFLRPNQQQPHLILTDDPEAAPPGQDLPVLGRLYGAEGAGSGLRLAGWWAEPALLSPHWALVETGAWPGGGGRQIPSSVVLVAGRIPEGLLELAGKRLAQELPAGWRGLVQLDVELGEQGAPEFGELRAGWPDLHHQALFSLQPSAAEALQKGPAVPPGVVFATVLSIPPWPSPPTRASRPVPLSSQLSEAARRQIVWHDVEVHRGRLRTAGLDGLVGVGVAQARFLRTARAVVFDAARELGLTELQVRSDGGELCENVLVGLEKLRWI